jgi:hypothetical protein
MGEKGKIRLRLPRPLGRWRWDLEPEAMAAVTGATNGRGRERAYLDLWSAGGGNQSAKRALPAAAAARGLADGPDDHERGAVDPGAVRQLQQRRVAELHVAGGHLRAVGGGGRRGERLVPELLQLLAPHAERALPVGVRQSDLLQRGVLLDDLAEEVVSRGGWGLGEGGSTRCAGRRRREDTRREAPGSIYTRAARKRTGTDDLRSNGQEIFADVEAYRSRFPFCFSNKEKYNFNVCLYRI